LSAEIWPVRSSSEASGRAAAQKTCEYRLIKEAGEKEAGSLKLTLAFGIGLGEVPVLPQQLLKELLPEVEGALYKLKVTVKPCRCFGVSR
jgi:hypothetical protein